MAPTNFDLSTSLYPISSVHQLLRGRFPTAKIPNQIWRQAPERSCPINAGVSVLTDTPAIVAIQLAIVRSGPGIMRFFHTWWLQQAASQKQKQIKNGRMSLLMGLLLRSNLKVFVFSRPRTYVPFPCRPESYGASHKSLSLYQLPGTTNYKKSIKDHFPTHTTVLFDLHV